MKKVFMILVLVAFTMSYAQFKDESNNNPDIKSSILNHSGSSGLLFGFFNPENFQMHHTFDISYSASGSSGLALSTYTNSMFYKFNDKLNIKADISVVNSPYNTFGSQFSKQLNGIYLSRAQLNFMPSKNMRISVEYSHLPYYNSYYSPYSYGFGYDPFFRNNNFFDTSPGEK